MSSTITFRKTRTLFHHSNLPDNTNKLSKRTTAATPPTHLCVYEDLPPWYQDNPWIGTAYRPVSHSVPLCLQSLTYLHNETLNIYTHAVPAVASVILLLYLDSLLATQYPHASSTDHFILLHNFLSASITFALSATYHTLMNHSYGISSLCLRIDYVGILILTHASFISGIYVGFFRDPDLRTIYWSMITILALITALLVLHPRLQGPRWRGLRTAAFIATATSGFVPIGHGLLIYEWDYMWERSGMPWWLAEGAVYALGALFFATRFPESMPQWRGKFDIWGCSHQIFHLLVIVAAMLHLYGAWDAWVKNYAQLHGPLS